jgi:hypothetical protein
VLTAATGFLDWLQISRGTPLWRTTTFHMVVMICATVVFAITAGAGHGSYVDGEMSVGYGILALGGWLGGTVVFVHGMRVLNLVEEPASRAASPVPHEEEVEAEKS